MELTALLCVCAMIVIGSFIAVTSENDREPGAVKFLSNGEDNPSRKSHNEVEVGQALYQGLSATRDKGVQSFERGMDELAAHLGGYWIHTSVVCVGLSSKHSGGPQRAIARLHPGDILYLDPELENKYDPVAVRVLVKNRCQIGFLPEHLGHEYLAGQGRGECFMTFVSKVIPAQNNRTVGVHIAVLRWTRKRSGVTRSHMHHHALLDSVSDRLRGRAAKSPVPLAPYWREPGDTGASLARVAIGEDDVSKLVLSRRRQK